MSQGIGSWHHRLQRLAAPRSMVRADPTPLAAHLQIKLWSTR
jgi:hypothetical protein